MQYGRTTSVRFIKQIEIEILEIFTTTNDKKFKVNKNALNLNVSKLKELMTDLEDPDLKIMLA